MRKQTGFTIFSLFLLFAISTSASATSNFFPAPTIKTGPLQQLNNKMRSLLALSPSQYDTIKKLNYSYWTKRERIRRNPAQIAAKTAVLAQWDQWQQALQQTLSSDQFAQFLRWQAQVDLLDAHPF